MFRINNDDLSAADGCSNENVRQAAKINIAQEKPFLLVRVSFPNSEEKEQTGTVMFVNLGLLFSIEETEARIEKVQLMEPAESLNDGWKLHDVVSIRTAWVRVIVVIDGSHVEEKQYREEYHTAEGRCFTFSELSDENPGRESDFELVYSEALGVQADWNS